MGEYVLCPEIPGFRICVHNKRVLSVGGGAVDKRNFAWHLANSGGGGIIGMEQGLPAGKTAFIAQWASEKQGWQQEVWVRALRAKGGGSAFHNSFLKFEPGELLER